MDIFGTSHNATMSVVYSQSDKMRLLTASLLIACMGVFSTRGYAQWTQAKIPGEKNRTVQGCAGETRQRVDWVCVFVRCVTAHLSYRDQAASERVAAGCHFQGSSS